MSVSSTMITRLERLGDRFNPIVVKEVRQALKSRQFVTTFLLLLLAAWAGSIFGVSYLGESIDYGSPAVTFYAGFLFALCTATLVIVPFSTFRSIVEERTDARSPGTREGDELHVSCLTKTALWRADGSRARSAKTCGASASANVLAIAG